jgi:hypothetical protein
MASQIRTLPYSLGRRFFISCTVYSTEKRNLHTPFVPSKSLSQNSIVGQLLWEDGRRLGP